MITIPEDDAQKIINRLLTQLEKYERALQMIADSKDRSSAVAKRALL